MLALAAHILKTLVTDGGGVRQHLEETIIQLRDRKAKGNYDVDATMFGAGHVTFANSDGHRHLEAEK